MYSIRELKIQLSFDTFLFQRKSRDYQMSLKALPLLQEFRFSLHHQLNSKEIPNITIQDLPQFLQILSIPHNHLKMNYQELKVFNSLKHLELFGDKINKALKWLPSSCTSLKLESAISSLAVYPTQIQCLQLGVVSEDIELVNLLRLQELKLDKMQSGKQVAMQNLPSLRHLIVARQRIAFDKGALSKRRLTFKTNGPLDYQVSLLPYCYCLSLDRGTNLADTLILSGFVQGLNWQIHHQDQLTLLKQDAFPHQSQHVRFSHQFPSIQVALSGLKDLEMQCLNSQELIITSLSLATASLCYVSLNFPEQSLEIVISSHLQVLKVKCSEFTLQGDGSVCRLILYEVAYVAPLKPSIANTVHKLEIHQKQLNKSEIDDSIRWIQLERVELINPSALSLAHFQTQAPILTELYIKGKLCKQNKKITNRITEFQCPESLRLFEIEGNKQDGELRLNGSKNMKQRLMTIDNGELSKYTRIYSVD